MHMGDDRWRGDANTDSEKLVNAAREVWNGSNAVATVRIAVCGKLVAEMSGHGITQLESAFITDSDIRHIMKHHSGPEDERGQLEVGPEDFAFLPEVLNSFDTCDHTDTDKLGNKKFLVTKTIGDAFYVVTIQRGMRKIQIKTMWKRPGASC